jgi:hypothetical protein
MRGLAVMLALALAGCSTAIGGQLGSFEFAIQTTAIDPRISEKLVTVDENGTQIAIDKKAISPQAAEAAKVIVPAVAAAVIKALVAQGVVAAACQLPGLVGGGDTPEIPSEGDLGPLVPEGGGD